MSLASAPLALCGSNENKQAMNILHPPTQNINGLEEYGPEMFRKFSLPVRDELCTFKYPSSAIPKDVFPSKTLVPHVIRSYITSQQQKRQMMMMKMMRGWGIPWRHHSYRISAQGGEENDKAKAQIVCISPKCRCPHCLLIPHLTNDHKKPVHQSIHVMLPWATVHRRSRYPRDSGSTRTNSLAHVIVINQIRVLLLFMRTSQGDEECVLCPGSTSCQSTKNAK